MTVNSDLVYKRGLPSNLEAERLVLGSIALNGRKLESVACILGVEDFSLEKHRRIFARMKDLHARGEIIDRVTIADELMKQGQLESVDGLGYLASLDDGLPDIANLEAYIRIVQDKSLKRRAIFAQQRFIEELIQDESNGQELLSRAERSISELRSKGRTKGAFLTPEQIIHEVGGVDELMSPRALAGSPTPWPSFNELLLGGGFSPGQMVVIGARPSQGKTSMATNIALHAAKNRTNVFFVSLEMSSREILTRMICAHAQVDMVRLSQRESESWERQVIAAAISELTSGDTPNLNIWDSPNTSVMSLQSELRWETTRRSVGMVLIDYLQLMETPRTGKQENRNAAVTEISRGLKLLARELECPVVVLSQLSRDSEKHDRRPGLSDLRDSGAIEQDADIVIFPYSQKIVGRQPDSIPYEFILAKQRNGPIGSRHMVFLPKFTRFVDTVE